MAEQTNEPNRTGDDTMGRPPIHDAPMTPAERQRRRRQRMRREPWRDTRALVWSLVAGLRGLRAQDGGPLDEAAVAALVERAAEEFETDAEGAEKIVAALRALLDPGTSLPERRGRGHRFGDRRRARHGRRHGRGD